MNQTEVIPKVQGNRCFEIGQFLGEGQGETVESSDFHSERQVLAFDIGRANLTVVGNAKSTSVISVPDTRGGA